MMEPVVFTVLADTPPGISIVIVAIDDRSLFPVSLTFPVN